jgi:archaellum component FlaF (FlaF/FlaG flagellin family)
MKQVVSVLLVFTIVFASIPISFADVESDYYNPNEKEYVDINGSIYRIDYEHDQYSTTYITNTANGSVEILTFDKESGSVFSNGILIASIQDTTCDKQKQNSFRRGWVWECDDVRTLSILDAITPVALAVIIGYVIGGAGAGIIMTEMGLNVLNGIAGYYDFITIEYSLYSQDLPDRAMLWYNWAATPYGGSWHGWYNTYFTYMYYE